MIPATNGLKFANLSKFFDKLKMTEFTWML